VTAPNGALSAAEVFEKRIARERAARKDAERLLETKSLELYQTNQALKLQARTDSVTGLLNRRALHEEIAEQIPQALQSNKILAFALVDIDRFKSINETLGHQLADHALIKIAERLKTAVPNGAVARWGGDEFGICVLASDLDEVRRIFAHTLQAASSEYSIAGRSMEIKCSIGVALAPIHAQSSEELERLADTALFAAKKSGRGTCVIFDDELLKSQAYRLTIESALRHAVHQHSIMPWFQPIYEIDGGRMVSLEILARWDCPRHGFIPPTTFLPIAGELGLLDILDSQVARAGFVSARDWVQSQQIESISLNISPRYVNDGGLPKRIKELLDATGLSPKGLVLELTEDAVFEDFAGARRLLEGLSSTGIRIALDDFGTGYSNLRALADLPLSYVKLDRSLVASIETDMRSRTLLGAVVHLAKTLRLDVTAEGVENDIQAMVLRILGVDRVQGFLYSKAVPRSEIQELLCAEADSGGRLSAPAAENRAALRLRG
jgi:diguanylate cyclase (GGDEF)-like protein